MCSFAVLVLLNSKYGCTTKTDGRLEPSMFWSSTNEVKNTSETWWWDIYLHYFFHHHDRPVYFVIMFLCVVSEVIWLPWIPVGEPAPGAKIQATCRDVAAASVSSTVPRTVSGQTGATTETFACRSQLGLPKVHSHRLIPNQVKKDSPNCQGRHCCFHRSIVPSPSLEFCCGYYHPLQCLPQGRSMLKFLSGTIREVGGGRGMGSESKITQETPGTATWIPKQRGWVIPGDSLRG